MPLLEHTEKTNAEDKSIGFDFQYYYFLNALLNLKTNESVGLEVMDDVHSELANDVQLLIQLKHTIQTKADGTPINLTTSDSDMWKTLSNWCKVVQDDAAGRKEEKEQLDFVEKTYFLLASNKSENKNNVILTAIESYQHNSNYSDLLTAINSLKATSKNPSIKNYIQQVLSLYENVAKTFFTHISFDLGCDDIIQQCKTSIREKQIDDTRIDDVFRALDSQLRTDNYQLVKSKKKIIITFEEFHKKYKIHFDRARNTKLVIRDLVDILPAHISEQTFIKQLLDINDIKQNNIEDISKFTRERLNFHNNIYKWYEDGDITQEDMKEFQKNAENIWANKFRRSYRSELSDDKISEAALQIVDELRETNFAVAGETLPTEMSNGSVYELSDHPVIGWVPDWESKYK